jgi:hypothetical protein
MNDRCRTTTLSASTPLRTLPPVYSCCTSIVVWYYIPTIRQLEYRRAWTSTIFRYTLDSGVDKQGVKYKRRGRWFETTHGPLTLDPCVSLEGNH